MRNLITYPLRKIAVILVKMEATILNLQRNRQIDEDLGYRGNGMRTDNLELSSFVVMIVRYPYVLLILPLSCVTLSSVRY